MIDAIDPNLRWAIEREKAKITVEPYSDVVMNKSFKIRTAGLWSGVALGLLYGTVVGLVAVYALPLLLGITTGAHMAGLAGVAKFAAAGVAIGGLAGQIIGASAGASAAAAEERERRELGRRLEREILRSPELQQELMAKYGDVDPEKAPLHSFEDALRESQSRKDTFASLFNIKTFVTSGLLCAALGVVLASGGWLDGFMQGVPPSAQILYGAGIMGAMGTAFGFSFPLLYTSLTNFFGSILTGEIFQGKGKQKARRIEVVNTQDLYRDASYFGLPDAYETTVVETEERPRRWGQEYLKRANPGPAQPASHLDRLEQELSSTNSAVPGPYRLH